MLSLVTLNIHHPVSIDAIFFFSLPPSPPHLLHLQTTATGLPKALTQAITEEEMKAGGTALHGKMVRGVLCGCMPLCYPPPHYHSHLSSQHMTTPQ